MKIAIINDTHFGIRNDSPIFLDYFSKFYNDVFFPELDKRGITEIVHLGDLFDRRKYINFNTLMRTKNDFVLPIIQKKYKFTIIAGNHDVFYKNNNDLNSLTELLGAYQSDNFDIIIEPKNKMIGNKNILMLPWICDENREHVSDTIKSTKSRLCFAHLELIGFDYYKGMVADHGDDPSDYKKFDMVLTGHYHTKSQQGNISYLGAPCEYVWTDYNDPKGFHIFDTSNYELEFIQNPYTIFKKISYHDHEITLEDVNKFNFSTYKDTFIKLIIQSKSNPFILDMFIENLEKIGIADLQVIEEELVLDDTEVISESEDTITILRKFVDSLPTKVDKRKLNSILLDLHNESLSVE